MSRLSRSKELSSHLLVYSGLMGDSQKSFYTDIAWMFESTCTHYGCVRRATQHISGLFNLVGGFVCVCVCVCVCIPVMCGGHVGYGFSLRFRTCYDSGRQCLVYKAAETYRWEVCLTLEILIYLAVLCYLVVYDVRGLTASTCAL